MNEWAKLVGAFLLGVVLTLAVESAYHRHVLQMETELLVEGMKSMQAAEIDDILPSNEDLFGE